MGRVATFTRDRTALQGRVLCGLCWQLLCAIKAESQKAVLTCTLCLEMTAAHALPLARHLLVAGVVQAVLLCCWVYLVGQDWWS
jgi:hypothetical protein